MPEGKMFGELGLIYNRPRAATCIALDQVELAEMVKNDFFASLMRIQNHSEALKRIFFEDWILKDPLSKFLAPKLGIMFEREVFPLGHKFIIEGSPCSKLYCIYSGEVAIQKDWTHAVQNKMNAKLHRNRVRTYHEELVIASKGDIIGVEVLYDTEIPYHFTYIAKSEVICYSIDKPKLSKVATEIELIQEILNQKVKLKKSFNRILLAKFSKIISEKKRQISVDINISLLESPMKALPMRNSTKLIRKQFEGIIKKSESKANPIAIKPTVSTEHGSSYYLDHGKIRQRVKDRMKGIGESSVKRDLEYLKHFTIQTVIRKHDDSKRPRASPRFSRKRGSENFFRSSTSREGLSIYLSKTDRRYNYNQRMSSLIVDCRQNNRNLLDIETVHSGSLDRLQFPKIDRFSESTLRRGKVQASTERKRKSNLFFWSVASQISKKKIAQSKQIDQFN